MADREPINLSFSYDKKKKIVVMIFDPNVEGSDSSTGKTKVLASTRGQYDLGDLHKSLKNVKLNVNAYKK